MHLKTVVFTVRATEKQSLEMVAGGRRGGPQGGRHVARRNGGPLPGGRGPGGKKLVPTGWRRRADFSVRLTGLEEMTSVAGAVSRPFAYYRGTNAGADRYSDFYTLVYFPSGRIIATLRLLRSAVPSLPSWRASGCAGAEPSPSKIPSQPSNDTSGRTCN